MLSQSTLTERQSVRLAGLMHVAGDIERIGDQCENIAGFAQFKIDERLSFSQAAIAEVSDAFDRVTEMVAESITCLREGDTNLARKVIAKESDMDELSQGLGKAYREIKHRTLQSSNRNHFRRAASLNLEELLITVKILLKPFLMTMDGTPSPMAVQLNKSRMASIIYISCVVKNTSLFKGIPRKSGNCHALIITFILCSELSSQRTIPSSVTSCPLCVMYILPRLIPSGFSALIKYFVSPCLYSSEYSFHSLGITGLIKSLSPFRRTPSIHRIKAIHPSCRTGIPAPTAAACIRKPEYTSAGITYGSSVLH